MMTALIGTAFPSMVAFITGPILAHTLGPIGRGEVAAATAPLTLATTIATFGIPDAVTYVVARNRVFAKAAAGRGIMVLFVGGMLTMIGVFFLAPILSNGNNEVEKLIYLAALMIVPTLTVTILRGVASAKQKWRLVTIEQILSSLLRLVILVPFWLTGTLSPLIATIAIAAMPLVGACVYARILRNDTGDEVPPLIDEVHAAALVRYGSRIWIGTLTGILLSRLDQTIMNPLAGAFQLGLYVTAVSIAELPLIINQAVRNVTFVTDAKESVDARLAASARISLFLCTVFGAVIGVAMIWGIPFLFGERFSGAIPVTAVLLVGVVLGTPGSVGGSGLSARGRPGLRSWSLVIACAVNVAMLVVLTPTMGAMGAALATLVGNFIASQMNLIFLSRVFGIKACNFYGIRGSDLATIHGMIRRMSGVLLRTRASS